MAILHFELEIDSEVYPELYARLASLSRTSARAEKLRQLAATGLLWEMARLHGPALADLLADLGGDLPAPASEVSPARGLAPDARAVASFPDEAVAQVPIATAQVLDHPDASSGPAPAVPAPPSRPSPGERAPPPPSFVDLALDVAPASVPAPEVPTLVDEVPPSLLHEVPAVTMAMVVPIRGSEAAPASSDEHDEHDEPREPTVRRSASRERLKRMRDRGLFQNG